MLFIQPAPNLMQTGNLTFFVAFLVIFLLIRRLSQENVSFWNGNKYVLLYSYSMKRAKTVLPCIRCRNWGKTFFSITCTLLYKCTYFNNPNLHLKIIIHCIPSRGKTFFVSMKIYVHHYWKTIHLIILTSHLHIKGKTFLSL